MLYRRQRPRDQNRCITIGIAVSLTLTALTLTAAPASQAATKVAKASASKNSPTWHQQMRRLADTLVDAYPFFYTLTAFRSPENHKTVTNLIAKIKANVHGVPTKLGENLLRDEPLVQRTRERMEAALTEAEIAYKKKEFDRAQSLIHSAIDKCVACHTAQGSNLNFPKTNDEMLNIFTPTKEKTIGLIAIRQFDGALVAIENAFSGKSKYREPPDQLLSLAKLHLLVSLRALGQADKARSFIELAQKAPQLSTEDRRDLGVWDEALISWAEISKKKPTDQLDWIAQRTTTPPAGPDSYFPFELLRTRILHNSLTQKLSPDDRSRAYSGLARSYKKLRLDTVKDLSEIYQQACADISKEEKLSVSCDAIAQ